jgi:hypothetical protein
MHPMQKAQWGLFGYTKLFTLSAVFDNLAAKLLVTSFKYALISLSWLAVPLLPRPQAH